MKIDTLICGDELYHLDAAYKAGARAMRQSIPWNVGNPYRDGTQQYDQWSYGHVNESAGEHIRFGVDVIEVAATGQCFVERSNRGEATMQTGERFFRGVIREPEGGNDTGKPSHAR